MITVALGPPFRATQEDGGESHKECSRRGRRSRCIGWTDRIPTLLQTHHCVISKAGGAAVQEAMAARCPLLIDYIVPGQEEGNAGRQSRPAARGSSEDVKPIDTLLVGLLADERRLLRSMRAAAKEVRETRQPPIEHRQFVLSQTSEFMSQINAYPLRHRKRHPRIRFHHRRQRLREFGITHEDPLTHISETKDRYEAGGIDDEEFIELAIRNSASLGSNGIRPDLARDLPRESADGGFDPKLAGQRATSIRSRTRMGCTLTTSYAITRSSRPSPAGSTPTKQNR